MQPVKPGAKLSLHSRRSCRSSTRNNCCLLLLLFFAVRNDCGDDFVFVLSPVVSAARETLCQNKILQRKLYFRGGADDVPSKQDNEQDNEQDNANTEGTKKRARSKSFLSAAFLMNEVAKEEASATKDDKISDDDSSDEEKIEARSKLVGGAFVKDGQASSAAEPLYKSDVSPMAARLLTDPSMENSEQVDNSDESSDGSASDLARLWWVNVWTQQLSEAPEAETIDDGNATSHFDESSGEEESQNEETFEDIEGDEDMMKPTEDTLPQHDETSAVEAEEHVEPHHNDTAQSELHESPIIEDKVKEVDDSSPLRIETTKSQDIFVSSGLWIPIDNLLTFGLASKYQNMKVSRSLRQSRKLAARLTGFHGLLSGKPYQETTSEVASDESQEEMTGYRKRVEAIVKARESVEQAVSSASRPRKRFPFFTRRRRRNKSRTLDQEDEKEEGEDDVVSDAGRGESLAEGKIEEGIREERVKDIDRLIVEGQERLQQLICEKDVLQRRPNPLYTYESIDSEKLSGDSKEASDASVGVEASRDFKFPRDDLVEEYLEMIFWSRRLTKMNHTFLWKDSDLDEEDEEERIGDDLLTPSAEAHKLYRDSEGRHKNRKSARVGNGGGGSWLLRQSIGKGPSLGEKIGEAAETAAYKAVAGAVMSILARALSSLHGINVLKHTDIRLTLEQAPDLPPIGVSPGGSKDYAQEAIKTAIRRRTKKGKKRPKQRPLEDLFVQRDAVTEMLLSHVQISAPLLKLFPLGWQRALLGNIITLSTAVMSDFCDGLQFQILGYQLSFAFKPITEEDMINHLGLAGGGFNHRRTKPEDFEAAVKATAQDISEELKFLDRWHERALGSGVLRTQIANLIARIVLTLTDEVLSGARMDLWSAHAGGPRMIAGLEYRTQPN